MAPRLEVEVYRDGRLVDGVKVASYDYDNAQHKLDRVYLATCPGGHCNCPDCRAMKERAMAAAKAPLGQRFDKGPKYVAVVLAGHKQIKVLGLFTRSIDALAYVKANYKTEPLGKTKFVTTSGEVLIIQEHVRVLGLEEAP